MTPTPEIGVMFLKTSGMLLVVIAALVGVLYAMRRMSFLRGIKGGNQPIAVLATHHFSPREKVALITVYDKTLLIGLTQQSISCLTTFEAKETVGLGQAVAQPKRGFHDLIRQSLGRSDQAGPEQEPVSPGNDGHED